MAADLILRGSWRSFYRMMVFPSLIVGSVLLFHGLMSGPLGVMTWIYVGAFGLLTLAGVVQMLLPYRLVADARGVSWRRRGRTQFYAWEDIEEIGVGRAAGFQGYDKPVVRLLTQGAVQRIEASTPSVIGLNLRAHASPEKNPATRAYKQGFTGDEINIPSPFDASATLIVAELQARLDAARRRSAPV